MPDILPSGAMIVRANKWRVRAEMRSFPSLRAGARTTVEPAVNHFERRRSEVLARHGYVK
jgi:hypothetical protein